jgi:hypothetical protein
VGLSCRGDLDGIVKVKAARLLPWLDSRSLSGSVLHCGHFYWAFLFDAYVIAALASGTFPSSDPRKEDCYEEIPSGFGRRHHKFPASRSDTF